MCCRGRTSLWRVFGVGVCASLGGKAHRGNQRRAFSYRDNGVVRRVSFVAPDSVALRLVAFA